MSTAEATELTDVLNRVNAWPTTLRITLAHKILESLDNAQAPRHRRTRRDAGCRRRKSRVCSRRIGPRRMTRQSNDGSMSVGWRNTAYEASGQKGTGNGGGQRHRARVRARAGPGRRGCRGQRPRADSTGRGGRRRNSGARPPGGAGRRRRLRAGLVRVGGR